jgi:hypothetical protein
MRVSAAVAAAQQTIGFIPISAALFVKTSSRRCCTQLKYFAPVATNSNHHQWRIAQPKRLILFARFCAYLVTE